MKISFAICTHNEYEYIDSLLFNLISFVEVDAPITKIEYEIVVVDDFSDDEQTLQILKKYSNKIKLYTHALNNHYADHKNFMNSCCSGDWIFNLDADEFVTDDFLGFIPQLIDMNPNLNAFWIPRINTVDGLTIQHLQRWSWTISKFEDKRRIKVMDIDSAEYKLLKGFDYIISEEDGVVIYYEPIVAWPDFQMRLYRNSNDVHWINAVHERLMGVGAFGMLPADPQLAIHHYKHIERQEKQNDFYDTITR